VSLAALLALYTGCTGTEFEDDPKNTYTEAGTPVWDSGYTPPIPCKPGNDADGDGIPDEKEGCNPATDTDNDKTPDYMDPDSDGDGVPDSVEGTKDSDGDKRPDYKDKDSDNDGVEDGDEDLNGDGKFGCCLKTCGESRKGCPTTKPGACGLGQTCKGGKCNPQVSFLCSDGETDPRKKSTYGGGTSDKNTPTFICRKASEVAGKGLKEVDFKTSSAGAWKVALEKKASYGDISLSAAKAKEAAGAFDYKGGNQIVAGFVASFAATAGADVTKGSAGVIAAIKSKLSGVSSALTLSSGSKVTSHDKFPTVVSTQLAVKMKASQKVGAVRAALLAAILGRSSVNAGSAGYGNATADFTVKFLTQLRKDGRIIVLGGVAPANMASDVKQATGANLEDLSNGSGLATLGDSATVECDPFILSRNPVADIIWVVDESGSMSDNLADIVKNATDFFARAVKSGLDFRMGVTGVADPNDFNPFQPKVIVGKMCGQLMPPPMFDFSNGGPDRFLLPSEQKIFKSCIANPPYKEGSSEYGLAHAYEGVTRHLPRKAGDQSKIRPGASLAIIIATDEAPKELKGGKYKGQGPSYKANGCSLTATSQAEVNKYLGPWFTLFGGKDPKWGSQARAMVHLIGGLCGSSGGSSSCSAEVGHGYLELVKATGGIAADICQKNLGTTLQIIIDAITGAASPAVLQYVPISASLAVALDNKQLKRSRASGFDYVGFSNSLVFVGVKIPKGSKVVASYRRWVKQATVK